MPYFMDVVKQALSRIGVGGEEQQQSALLVPDIPAEPAEKVPSTTLSPKDWTNPGHRIELPADFPAPLDHDDSIGKVMKALEKELKKEGLTLQDVDRVTVVYPHKHPGLYPGHQDNAAEYAEYFAKKMQDANGPLGKITWGLASELVETRKLGRSEDQSSVHALTAKQEYVFFDGAPKPMTSTIALLGDNRKEFFVVVDMMCEQGTTFANLISHVRHNGGIVLATVGANDLLQGKSKSSDVKAAKLPSKFVDPARNTGRLPELSLALAESAQKHDNVTMSPAEALDKFDKALKKNGNSVFALTDGEVTRIIATVKGRHDTSETFFQMLGRLDQKAAAAIPAPPPKAKPEPFRM